MRRTARAIQLLALVFGLMATAIGAGQPAAPTAALFSPTMSDAELRERISSLVPAAADNSRSDEDRVAALRAWLNAFLLLADNYTCSKIDHNRASLAELLALNEQRHEGYLCGAVAVIAQRIYGLFGFEAVTLNFGFPESGATHITTLVRLRTPEGPIWSVQAANFDHTVTDRAGRLMDFRDLVRLLAEGRSGEVVVRQDPASRSLMAYGNQQNLAEIDAQLSLSAELVSRHPSFAIYRVQWRMEPVLAGIPSYRESLRRSAGTNDPLYLFLYPISHSGSEAAAALANAAADARVARERRLAKRDQP